MYHREDRTRTEPEPQPAEQQKSAEYQTFAFIVKKAFSMKKDELDEGLEVDKAARKKRQSAVLIYFSEDVREESA